jgi:hypothetical protein
VTVADAEAIIAKSAQVAAPPAFTPAQIQEGVEAIRGAAVDEQTKQWLWRLGAGALGAGALMRGLNTLGTLPSTANRLPGESEAPLAVDIPFPSQPARSMAQLDSMRRGQRKAAQEGAPTFFDRWIRPGLKWTTDAATGQFATSPLGKPWFWMAGLPLAAGSGAVGWYGIGAAQDAMRRSQVRSEYEQAKEDFNKALLETYDAPRSTAVPAKRKLRAKAAFDACLDLLHDHPEGEIKQADISINDFPGGAVGILGMLGLLTGGASAAAGYGLGKSRSRDDIVAAAQEKRRRMRAMTSPPELVVRPFPIEQLQMEPALVP